ncbi:hypothetical protein GNH96_13150 [Methylococcus geothermalis]|uniref:Transposase n=1 Tax=Methylococcus geothermalis TaxID=2681310 RepID=A0A858QAB5_9GAMM|nr:hypothetical protein GNH96_13150 [Methylococcus geothermalis]
MNITTAGIDLAKNVFRVHGVDVHDKVVLKKTVSRGKLLECLAKLPPCVVGMDAVPVPTPHGLCANSDMTPASLPLRFAGCASWLPGVAITRGGGPGR